MQDGEQRRVVVTGVGMITPLGATADATWEGLVAGRSGIATITRFDSKGRGLEVHIAGEANDFDPLQYMDRRGSSVEPTPAGNSAGAGQPAEIAPAHCPVRADQRRRAA